MDLFGKTKISADFIFAKLLCVGGSILSFLIYLQKRKSEDLYTELYFLGIIFFLIGFIYFFTKPKVFFDDSNLYFIRINNKEVQIPLKKITSIFDNPFFYTRGGISFYEIEYLSEANEVEKVKFQSDSQSVMQDFKNSVSKINPSVEIV